MPVRRRIVAEAAEPDEGADRFARAFPGLRVSAQQTSTSFHLAYRRVETERFSVNRVRCSGRLLAVGPLPDSVAVGRRSAGTVSIRHGERTVDTTRPYLRPVAQSEFELQEGGVMLVTLQPAALAEYLDRSGERGPLVSRLQTAPHLAAWGLVMDHAATFLDDPDALTGQVEDELHDLLCWSVLHAFEDPWAETMRAGTRSTALKRAMRYLDEHAHEAVSMPEVAEAARISVRMLAVLFRNELGTTPYRWLRDLRLDRARLDLLDGSGSVSEVATRHGFGHAGRFAAEYRTRFAEHPSTTVRGTPPRA